MPFPHEYSLSGTIRKLLLVSFFTLSLVSLAFIVAVYQFDRNNRTIFSSVETILHDSSTNSALYQMLISLELDIRELINIVLREPYRLTLAKKELNEKFKLIQLEAEQGGAGDRQRRLQDQLHGYRTSLNKLLWDYGEVNSVLYEVYFYLNNIQEQLRNMEDRASVIMVDLAMEGRNTEAVQHAYVLSRIAREMILEIHILVDSGVRDNKLYLLTGGERGGSEAPDGNNAMAKLESLAMTMRTLTAAEEAIARHAVGIQQTIPLLQDNIFELAVHFNTLNDHYSLFVEERDKTMNLLEDLNRNTRDHVFSINRLIGRHGANTRLAAGIISFVVLVISIVGLILTRKMSSQLKHAAGEVIRAREEGEKLNLMLQEEVVGRNKIAEDLRQARDELEQRVRERTADLYAANRGLALEIEERKNAEYELASEKEQLAVTLRSIGDGVITTNLEGRVILMNRVAEKLTGWSQEEAMGKPLIQVFNIVGKNTRKDCNNPVEYLLKNNMVYSQDENCLLVARDGSERDIAESCAVINDRESKTVGAVLVFRDVTEKKRMESDALKAEKLRSVGVLAGGIAHDFNNILAAILGNISLAKLQTDRETAANAWNLLDGAEKASLRARNLTQQLLTFSKGGEPVKKVALISEIIKDSANFILTGSKIQCEYDIEEDLWPVNIDAGQMSQVVQNIIINAKHVMPDGGRIYISCVNFINENKKIGSLAPGSYVKISIRDTGPGIPPELHDRIFDPYFTTKSGGSGLGLALTHSIVSKHRGLIKVESNGPGATFVLYLPAMPGRAPEPEPESAPAPAETANARILVMDDEEMVRDVARNMLDYLGYAATTVSSGEEAVTAYAESLSKGDPFDAVIMDLTIPGGMGGKTAMQKLLEIDPKVKGIVSSGYSNDPVMAQYKEYGFAGMVNKPFEIEELMKTLRNVLASAANGS